MASSRPMILNPPAETVENWRPEEQERLRRLRQAQAKPSGFSAVFYGDLPALIENPNSVSGATTQIGSNQVEH